MTKSKYSPADEKEILFFSGPARGSHDDYIQEYTGQPLKRRCQDCGQIFKTNMTAPKTSDEMILDRALNQLSTRCSFCRVKYKVNQEKSNNEKQN